MGNDFHNLKISFFATDNLSATLVVTGALFHNEAFIRNGKYACGLCRKDDFSGIDKRDHDVFNEDYNNVCMGVCMGVCALCINYLSCIMCYVLCTFW